MPLAVALYGVVLAEWMAFPVVGHHDAGQAWVAAEVNAEEVEDFALVEVGRGPDRGDGVDALAFRDASNHPDTLLQAKAKNRIADLKARFAGVPVDGGDVF